MTSICTSERLQPSSGLSAAFSFVHAKVVVFRVPARLLLLTSFSKNVQSGRWCRQPRQKQAGCLPTSGGRTALYFRSALGFSPPKHSQSRKSPWSVLQDGRVEPISSASLVEHGRGPRSGRRPLAVPPALHAVQGARGGGARAAPPKKNNFRRSLLALATSVSWEQYVARAIRSHRRDAKCAGVPPSQSKPFLLRSPDGC